MSGANPNLSPSPAARPETAGGEPRSHIRRRLFMSLGAIIVLMAIESAISFVQFLSIRAQTRDVDQADHLAMTVLRLHSDLFEIRDHLQLLLNPRNEQAFVDGVSPLRKTLERDIEQARSALAEQSGGLADRRLQMATLAEVRRALPQELAAMVSLVQAGDWNAAQRRLDHQVHLLSDSTGTLVDSISTQVRQEELRRMARIHGIEDSAFWTLLLTLLATVGVSSWTGWRFALSITRPLAELNAGAKTLAEGNFRVQVEPHGTDELAQLTRVFNGMAARLDHLYSELQRSEVLFRSLIEHSSDLIVLIGLDNIVRYASPSCGVLLGCASEDLIGQNVMQYVHPDDIAPLQQRFATQLSATGVSPVTEIRIRGIDQQWHTIEILLVDRTGDADIAGIIVNGRDIQARRELEDQLRQAQKMEAVGRLAAGVAHDFNNLLTVIQGNAELQLLQPNQPAAARAAFREIGDAADRAGALTRQLLTFSRRQPTSMKIIDLNEVLMDIESLLRRLIGEDVKLLVRPGDADASIFTDASLLQQVIINLAVNARDAMPRGGNLTIETFEADLKRPVRWTYGQIPPGHFVVLTVSDTGIGMDQKTQSRIFEPFFTTKEVGKGTGLGLATVYGIVQQNGGHVVFDSNPGEGSTFRIYLPRAKRSAPEGRETPNRLAEAGELIWVVQEEESLRLMMEEYLSDEGYRVEMFASAQEAVRRCELRKPTAALLIIAFATPAAERSQLLRTARSHCPKTRLLYTSTEPVAGDEPEAPFLLRPFSREGFGGKVKELLRERNASQAGTA